MKLGRPVEWTPERKATAQARICEQIALGRSLVSVCKEPGMPAYSTVMEWRLEDTSFGENYTRAREDQADYLADEVIDIADTATDPNLARVQIDARKWKAGRMKPKVYGDRLNLDADINIKLTDEQVEARLAYLAGKAGILGVAGGEGAPEDTPEVVLALPVDRRSET